MESEKSTMENPSVPVMPVKKPNYMLMSLQRIFVLSVIFAGVFVVVHYTPMPGTIISETQAAMRGVMA